MRGVIGLKNTKIRLPEKYRVGVGVGLERLLKRAKF